MRDAIKDLSLFGFDEFRPGNGIIKDLINEMAMYRGVIDATDESFWSEVEGSMMMLWGARLLPTREESMMDTLGAMIVLKRPAVYGNISSWRPGWWPLFLSLVLCLSVSLAK